MVFASLEPAIRRPASTDDVDLRDLLARANEMDERMVMLNASAARITQAKAKELAVLSEDATKVEAALIHEQQALAAALRDNASDEEEEEQSVPSDNAVDNAPWETTKFLPPSHLADRR